MRHLLAILLLLPALVSAQSLPASVDANWLTPRTAIVSYVGPGGPGVCLHRERANNLHKIYAAECGRPSGVVFLGVDAEPGDVFTLVAFDGVTLLAADVLGERPRYLMILPMVQAAHQAPADQ